MNRADLLRQLGWSDDLISEVTRVAQDMRKAGESVPSVQDAASALFIINPKANTSTKILASDCER